jgi:iron(III) transport system ATP-binding protein
MLKLDGISFAYGDNMILKDVSMRMAPGTIGALIGPSGCGKTTLLRIIAGLETPISGVIEVNKTRVEDQGITIPAEKRKIGMVFQNYALFPHMTVEGNISFPIQQLPRNERKARVTELLNLVHLDGQEKRYPHQLSGGQQQRVAIARALAQQPDILLMDEPLSNLDAKLRDQLGQDLKQLLKKLGITTLIVTHDQHEAWQLADEIGVMFDGNIVQWGSFADLTKHPVTPKIKQFVMANSTCDICGQIVADTHSHAQILKDPVA